MEGDFRVGEWLVQPQLNRIKGLGKKATSVEPKAMEVLVFLAEHSGEVLPKERIIQAVWPDTFVTDDVLAHAISELRKAFGDEAKNSRIILTVPKRGYRLLLPVSKVLAPKEVQPVTSGRKERYWMVAAVVLLLPLLVVSVVHFTQPVHEERLVRFSMSLPEEVSFSGFDLLAISPDGLSVAFTGSGEQGTSQLWVRPLDSLTATPLAGTEGAQQAFWSPDSRFIGFFAGGELKKIATSGGPAQILCDTTAGRGGTWNREGVIVFGNSRGGLYRISEDEGTPVPVTTLDRSRGEVGHRFPHFLPDGRHFLYVVEGTPAEQRGIYLGSLDAGTLRQVLSDYSKTVNVPPGYLLFVREGTLMARPFDAKALEVTGEAFPALEGVAHRADLGVGYFSASQDGVLIYRPGGDTRQSRRPKNLFWVDREGREELLSPETRPYDSPRISPDGTRVAVSVSQTGNLSDVWIYDLTHETSTPLTFDAARLGNRSPVWTPDGRRVVFRSIGETGRSNLFWKAADGTGLVEPLTTSPEKSALWPYSFTPDGKRLILNATGSSGLWNLHLLVLDGKRTLEPLFPTGPDKHSSETAAAISPDGRWLAYASNESGRKEVCVRPFPDVAEGIWQVSRNGGNDPVWGPDGRELFYFSPDSLMAVHVTTETTFTTGNPEALFTTEQYSGNYDIAPDGQRFLMLKDAEQTDEAPPSNQLIVVLNWLEELQSLVPAD